MKLQYLHAWPLAIGALAVVATIAMAPAAAAPPKPVALLKTTIYSETFTPLKRFQQYDSLQHKRYYTGPGNPPNVFEGPGYEAFFNTPDLTIGPIPMSVVSAEICLTYTGGSDDNTVLVLFGVQDKDRNGILWSDLATGLPGKVISASSSQQCEKLTLETPVQLVNHPHIVTALIMSFADYSEVDVDGVTYVLQPTQAGDEVPTMPFDTAASSVFGLQ